MKNPFKIGDNVKILPRDDSQKYSSLYVDGMLKYAGQLATITATADEFCLIDLDHGSWYWPFNALQSVTLKTNQTIDPHNLKNGDYIKITKSLSNDLSYIYIFKEMKDNRIYRHASYFLRDKNICVNPSGIWPFASTNKITYATVKEKKLMDEALLKQGYIWNSLTKQLESKGVNDTFIDTLGYAQKESQTETELNLFPKKKHYQLKFNY